MSAKLRVFASAASVAAVALVVSLVSVASADTDKVVIHVVERAVTDTFVDTDGDGGPTTGDLLTFHNKLYDETNTERVGRNQGQCILIDPENGAWECAYTNFLPGGHISVEGPFVEGRQTALAVIGGTGDYNDVSGIQQLSCDAAAATCDFVFRLNV